MREGDSERKQDYMQDCWDIGIKWKMGTNECVYVRYARGGEEGWVYWQRNLQVPIVHPRK